MNTMKAMVLEAFNQPVVLRELPMPVPAAGEVLVKVMATGVCFTDVKIQTGIMSAMGVTAPIIMGHEVAGVVEQLGEGVNAFSAGDRIVAFAYDTCDACYYCKRGIPALCEDVKSMLGATRNGGYAEYMVWPASRLMKIPDGVAFELAAVATDAVTTCYHALCERINLQAGDSILIIGIGGLGINAVQIAKARGAMVIAAGRSDEKLELAKHMGADYIFNITKVNLPEECRKVTNGRGVTYAGEFAGVPETSKLAFACLAPGGTQVQPGYSFGAPFEVDYQTLTMGERSIVASRAATMESLRGALKLVADGTVVPQIDPSAIVPLERVNEILTRLKSHDILGRGIIKFA